MHNQNVGDKKMRKLKLYKTQEEAQKKANSLLKDYPLATPYEFTLKTKILWGVLLNFSENEGSLCDNDEDLFLTIDGDKVERFYAEI